MDCDHEIDEDSGDCIVWTPDSFPHFVPYGAPQCRCHGYNMRDIARTFEDRLRD